MERNPRRAYRPVKHDMYLVLFIFPFIIVGCKDWHNNYEMKEFGDGEVRIQKPRLPGWHKNAVIYEVNLRQYTPEGTLNSFRKHIPRLREMGVDILWFMPIHPVSSKKRKGPLGSPYAVSDYRAINPNFGTLEEFKSLLAAVHDAGMHAIIDWVPNHTGWDHQWIRKHPDWYTRDSWGNITDPINRETGKAWGWTDVAELNYEVPEMRKAMIAEMAYWVEQIGVDGFRVDVAHGVPVDFWDAATDTLYALRPLFMLAEAEVPALINRNAFVKDYGWEMHHLLVRIAGSQLPAGIPGKLLVRGNPADFSETKQEIVTALDIDKQLKKQKTLYRSGYKMNFTSNHDENAWAGTEFQRFGAGHKAFAALVCTFDGMPLLYSGQESAVNKQYGFFEKDSIPWGTYEYAGFYRTLFSLKKKNKALWNGNEGGPLVKIRTGKDKAVYAFIRSKGGDKVVVVINLSAKPQKISLQGGHFEGTFTDIFNGDTFKLSTGWGTELEPWQYLVLSGTRNKAQNESAWLNRS